jgi:DNA-binding NtrC family response regulator
METKQKRGGKFVGKRVLVVDDDQVILSSFAHSLSKHGYDVETAETGHEAIEKCKSGSYDLTLLDIRLPDMDGTQLLEQLQEIEPKMITIMVTGYASLDSALRSLILQANAYVLKPVDPDELLKVVRATLNERQIE